MTARIIQLAQHAQEREVSSGVVRRARQILPWDVELSAICLLNGTHYHALRAHLLIDPAEASFCLVIFGRDGAPDKTLCLRHAPERVSSMSELLGECFAVPA